MVLRALHLCSGYAGFELALRLAGIPTVTVAHVERDSYAAAVLVARMADQTLDQAPVWSDLDTFDPAPFAGRVDIVTAGLPCQPFSSAGQRAGLDDHRHLWPMARRVIADVGPRLVLLENVPDVVGAGWLPHVCADLADLGFDAEWGLLSAGAVGAPHRRERFWLLGYADGARTDPHGTRRGSRHPAGEPGGLFGAPVADSEGRAARDLRVQPRLPETVSGPVADTAGEGHEGRRVRQPEPAQLGADVADTGSIGRGSRIGPDPHQRQSGRPDTTPRSRAWPPGPDDADGWRQWIAESGPQPQVRRRADGRPLGLADALHLGGNGLVPAVAAHALLQLADRAGVELT